MRLRLFDSPRKHAAIAVTAGILVVVGILGLAFTDLNPIVFERRQIRRAVTAGMSEKQVRQRLGAPAIEYAAGNAPEYYYVHGWSYKRRPISNKVLIYQFGEPIWLRLDRQYGCGRRGLRRRLVAI